MFHRKIRDFSAGTPIYTPSKNRRFLGGDPESAPRRSSGGCTACERLAERRVTLRISARLIHLCSFRPAPFLRYRLNQKAPPKMFRRGGGRCVNSGCLSRRGTYDRMLPCERGLPSLASVSARVCSTSSAMTSVRVLELRTACVRMYSICPLRERNSSSAIRLRSSHKV